MTKPQQNELRRSGKGATSDDSTKTKVTVDGAHEADQPQGRIPPDNRPGHHPDVEQDKPSGPPPTDGDSHLGHA